MSSKVLQKKKKIWRILVSSGLTATDRILKRWRLEKKSRTIWRRYSAKILTDVLYIRNTHTFLFLTFSPLSSALFPLLYCFSFFLAFMALLPRLWIGDSIGASSPAILRWNTSSSWYFQFQNKILKYLL